MACVTLKRPLLSDHLFEPKSPSQVVTSSPSSVTSACSRRSPTDLLCGIGNNSTESSSFSSDIPSVKRSKCGILYSTTTSQPFSSDLREVVHHPPAFSDAHARYLLASKTTVPSITTSQSSKSPFLEVQNRYLKSLTTCNKSDDSHKVGALVQRGLLDKCVSLEASRLQKRKRGGWGGDIGNKVQQNHLSQYLSLASKKLSVSKNDAITKSSVDDPKVGFIGGPRSPSSNSGAFITTSSDDTTSDEGSEPPSSPQPKISTDGEEDLIVTSAMQNLSVENDVEMKKHGNLDTALGGIGHGLSSSRPQMMYTLKQVTQICKRLCESQCEDLRVEFEKVLQEKLMEQYDSFVNYLQQHCNETSRSFNNHHGQNQDAPSYLS